jgi:hypothetical protein
VEVYRYVNPKAAKWPKADFIIGNPPFIGANDVRARLGDSYFDALFLTSNVPESADLVMHWWDLAATKVRKHQTRRFGFVTTNSLPQVFNRRVLKKHFEALDSLSVVFAISNHPWVSEKGDAAVRIAMTVGVAGSGNGVLSAVHDESRAPDGIVFQDRIGRIQSDLTIGAAVAAASGLASNAGLSFRGITLIGEGFVLSPDEKQSLFGPHEAEVVKPYLNGRDLNARRRGVFAIDLFGLSLPDAQARYPQSVAVAEARVRPFREQSKRASYRNRWWIFGEPRPDLRRAISGVERYIGTCQTSKHRFFQFLDHSALPDQQIIAIALEGSWSLGILSSRAHIVWALAAGGRLGVGDDPRYNNTRCFDPFPFPDTSEEALKDRIGDAAEKLDALRKDVLARHAGLTLTKLYNVLEALRAADKAGTVLSDKDRDIATRGCVSLIRQYHDTIDAAVAQAYGWPADLSDAEILERLVALNKVRAAEEAKGEIKWLRPDFQKPGYVAPREQKALALPEAAPTADVLAWPAALPDQFTAVAAVVDRAARPIAANDVARAFKGKNAKGIAPVLDTLAGMGRLRKLTDGRYAA